MSLHFKSHFYKINLEQNSFTFFLEMYTNSFLICIPHIDLITFLILYNFLKITNFKYSFLV